MKIQIVFFLTTISTLLAAQHEQHCEPSVSADALKKGFLKEVHDPFGDTHMMINCFV